MTREDMIALALESGFNDKQMDAMFYKSGPYDISFPTTALEAFYRAAVAAGQAEMRERCAAASWNHYIRACKKLQFSQDVMTQAELIARQAKYIEELCDEVANLKEQLAPALPIKQTRDRDER